MLIKFFEKYKKRKLLKRCAMCGRKPKIVNRGDGWYAIECFTRKQYHYGVGFSRGQYIKHFEYHATRWNDFTDEKLKQLNL